jgi:hypothetical protein
MLAACTTPPVRQLPAIQTTSLPLPTPTADSAALLPIQTQTVPPTLAAATTATPALPATPLPALPAGTAGCGLTLPVLAPETAPAVSRLAGNPSLAAVPEAARPAVEMILRQPGRAGLVAYELGREGEGLFLNPDLPLPLASVVKVIHLVAYAEAVRAGELDPAQPVLLADLERYYLANSDLNAHPDAVADLRAEGRVFGDPPAVLLEDVPRMMMQYSSNAATDYLHLLLGQERLEATIASLGLASHTAPCPFLGQFLLMGNGAGGATGYLAEPDRYAVEVMAATLAFGDEEGSAASRGWRGRTQRPDMEVQMLYSELFNAHASARDYASLMGRIAENQLGAWDHSVLIRRYLEWPTAFPANQSLAWLGYKGGSLPGVLTASYYAQPWDRARPVVVTLFLHDLPLETYRDWRRSLPNDELARWLLYDRNAIETLRTILFGD